MVKINIMGKEIEYTPEKDELYIDLMTIRIMNNRTFLRVFKRDLTNKFLNSMKKIIDPTHLFTANSILSMSGGTGSGKSNTVMSLIKMLVPSDRFSYKNFCFFDEQILQLAKTLPENSFIVRDEGTNKAVFGQGSNRQAKSVQLLAETSRKRGLSICFIEPQETRLDIVKWYLETVDMDVENRITRVALKDPSSMEYLGAIYIPVLPEDDEDWCRYNEVKDSFIKNVGEGKLSGAKMNYKKLVEEIIEKGDIYSYTKKKGMKAYLIMEYETFTMGEIETLLEVLWVKLQEA